MSGLSIGAIGAALIAAVVSVIGLILGKEQKTSEFRQAWIDALRNDITAYIVRLSAISDKLKVEYESGLEKIEALSEDYKHLNTASIGIKLRVNPHEELSKRLLAKMSEFERLSQNDKDLTSEITQDLEDDLLLASQELLKSEWVRVKSGEVIYQFAKYASMLMAAVLVIVFGWSVWTDVSDVRATSREQLRPHSKSVSKKVVPSDQAVRSQGRPGSDDERITKPVHSKF